MDEPEMTYDEALAALGYPPGMLGRGLMVTPEMLCDAFPGRKPPQWGAIRRAAERYLAEQLGARHPTPPPPPGRSS